MKESRLGVVDWLFVGVLLVIFGGIVLHAPLSVWFSTLWPDASLVIKSWKEILLGLALVLAAVLLTWHKRWNEIKTPLFYLIAAYAGLHLLLIPVFSLGFEATVAALFINLRFLLFFVLIYVALKLYPWWLGVFKRVFFAGAFLVIGFSVLQVTVLPHDVLKYIGYSESTIMPYLTVDENMDYIRINGTLRGPNPLGAYAAIVLVVSAAALVMRQKAVKWEKYGLWFLSIGSVVALWFSYSRSAAVVAVLGLTILALVLYGKRITKWVWVVIIVGALTVTGAFVAFRDTQFVSQVILHEDPHEGNDTNSNDGHVDSLVDGTERMLRQPLGAGVGSTGSPSLLGEKPLIIENQYLYIAHETGWLGLGLFISIYYLILKGLWQRRTRWVALSTFATGVGLAAAAFVLPVWADDTVSIIWWGLAAIALSAPAVNVTYKKGKR